MLIDTNVSCPEGINEVLAEDDVSWQIAKVSITLVDEKEKTAANPKGGRSAVFSQNLT